MDGYGRVMDVVGSTLGEGERKKKKKERRRERERRAMRDRFASLLAKQKNRVDEGSRAP